ncbi:MAG: hypothetical protein ACP5GJ_03905 [Nanopusillaceae archaeon]|jgi:uncharacterized Zn finger protein
MVNSKRYWILECPYCGNLSLYDSVREGKKKVKRCPYCGKYFNIIRDDEPSWKVIIAQFDNPKEASVFIRNRKINRIKEMYKI